MAAHDYPMSTSTITSMARHFDPCAATATMFLYAQGSSIVCCQHDALTIERRFSGHQDEVQLLAVNNVSESSPGRLVASYDASLKAILWDLLTGTEITSFESFSNLTSVAWMKNGNVAFGNNTGTITIFDPLTSEHLSFRTIDQIAVTALAPASDCSTYAIGYQNGSLLICNLQPRFTILHNLSTSRAPSPIVSLAWHASSARQRSDMLAVQTYDGDLRVWSVAKSNHSSDPAKTVRILKRGENYTPGPNWMGWSKNGRIIQFSEGETLSWDVRTKHVTYDSIPTLENIRGLALYGPGAILFTLGPNNTAQQFDLNAPAMMTANVQHPASLLPPSPPVSIEEPGKSITTIASSTPGIQSSFNDSDISAHLDGGVSESDEDHMSPFARVRQVQRIAANEDVARTISPTSSSSHISSQVSSQSSKPAPSNHPRAAPRYQRSVVSRGVTEHTYMSLGSSLGSPAAQVVDYPYRQPSASMSVSTSSTTSTNRSGRGGTSRPSLLRNEIPRSPEDNKVHDLFSFTRSRLNDIPYRMPPVISNAELTNDDLRRQMLSAIFGWPNDIRELIQDELSRHPPGSANRILLAKWLGDIDLDALSSGSESMTSSDWMILALSGIGGHANQHKLGRAYIQRLLESGDLNAAATIMIGMSDYNDAIEIYNSHHRYMEALLVACLFYPSVWERQAQIIKKWSNWASKHRLIDLALRCRACVSMESTEPWTSPSAAQLNFPSIQTSMQAPMPTTLSPPLSPPSVMQRGPQRSIAKSSALKLITTFGNDVPKAKFFLNHDETATPIAAGVTPIVDSALTSPVYTGSNDARTALLRPSQRSAFNTPSSAIPPGSFNRQRLPSIGETPVDGKHARKILKNISDAPISSVPSLDSSIDSTAYTSSHKSQASYRTVSGGENNNMGNGVSNNFHTGLSVPRASTSSPMNSKNIVGPPMSPSPASMALFLEGRNSRNGPRERIPPGIDLHIAPGQDMPTNDGISPNYSIASSNRYRWPSRRRGPASVSSSVTSASSIAAASRHNRNRTTETATTTKTLDDYISSLEAARSRARGRSSERRNENRPHSRETSRSRRAQDNATGGEPQAAVSGTHSRQLSAVEDRKRQQSRGYTTASTTGGKRSPRSPVPMSPEDLINLSTPKNFRKDAEVDDPDAVSNTARKVAVALTSSRQSSRSRPTSRASNRGRTTNQRSPERQADADLARGRNYTRNGSTARSPSSPLPFTSNAALYYASEDDKDDLQKALDEKAKFREKASGHRSRSSSAHQHNAASESAHGRGRSQSGHRSTLSADAIVAEPTTTASRKERIGPPPAPSAIAVAVGIGIDLGPGPSSESGRKRSSMSSNKGSMGDLKQLTEDERARRKAAAARELEERRKSLVRRPLAAPVVHPKDLEPHVPGTPESSRLDMPVQPDGLPLRSHASDLPTPGSVKSTSRTPSMFASRGQMIGLPATPKAMRLVLDSEQYKNASQMPQLPQAYQSNSRSSPDALDRTHLKNASPGMGATNESKTSSSPRSIGETAVAPTTAPAAAPTAPAETPAQNLTPAPAPPSAAPAQQEETLLLLPSTVYQPPPSSRGPTPRSMSAPPRGLFSPGKESAKTSPKPDAGQQTGHAPLRGSRRPSVDNSASSPQPPPPPPMLKELAHLAIPPPPPPAPLPPVGGMPLVYGGQRTGTIEVVTDDGEVKPITAMSPSSHSMTTSPLVTSPPPMPPVPGDSPTQSRNGHSRGRSSTDLGIVGRISRATERMRSASRGRNNASAASRTKSPEAGFFPYESIPGYNNSKSPELYAPYESVPKGMARSPELSYGAFEASSQPALGHLKRSNTPQQHHHLQQAQYQIQDQQQQQFQFQQLGQEQYQQYPTGLHESEMI